jgi:hypothetical protein
MSRHRRNCHGFHTVPTFSIGGQVPQATGRGGGAQRPVPPPLNRSAAVRISPKRKARSPTRLSRLARPRAPAPSAPSRGSGPSGTAGRASRSSLTSDRSPVCRGEATLGSADSSVLSGMRETSRLSVRGVDGLTALRVGPQTQPTTGRRRSAASSSSAACMSAVIAS